jgi:rubrerythrin
MKHKDKTFTCLSCGLDIPFKGYSYSHKYCNNQCQADHRNKLNLEKDLDLITEGKIKHRPRLKTLLSEIKGYQCECCNLSKWQGKEISLHVDHINGDPYNDKLENLRLLCPNCHSQTDTFAGKNRGNGRWTRENLSKYG